MAERVFTLDIRNIQSKPRSRRLRELGASSSGGGPTVVNVNGGSGSDVDPRALHTHDNKSVLDALGLDGDGYGYVTQSEPVTDPETGETVYVTVTRKVKAGFADEAGLAVHALLAEKARDLTDDSPVFQKFLRKDVADTAYGQITHKQAPIHEQGAQFGRQFVPGMVGRGGKVDGEGYGELRGLRLWEWLEVPELRFNRVNVYVGIRWDTFGAGIIESVTPDDTGLETGTGTLKLDDGEIGAIAVGDLCMGIWHDQTGNATEDTDDNRGGFTFAGFKTVYFQITSVSGQHNESFSYILRGQAEGGNGFHPFPQMHFAGRGNIQNTSRQAFVYHTTEYSLALTGVNTWVFQAGNYYEIRRHIEGFQMPAIDRNGHEYVKTFHGYGQVFGNAYIFGQIDQFERVAYRCFVDQSLEGQLAPGETESVTVVILNGYGEDVTDRFTHYSVTRNSGDPVSDDVWNAQHNNVGNPFNISFSDLGIDGIRQLLAVFSVMATDEAADITVNHTLEYAS